MIRTMSLNARDRLFYNTETGAWNINEPPDDDTPVRARRQILQEIEDRRIVPTMDALARIAQLPEKMEFRDD